MGNGGKGWENNIKEEPLWADHAPGTAIPCRVEQKKVLLPHGNNTLSSLVRYPFRESRANLQNYIYISYNRDTKYQL